MTDVSRARGRSPAQKTTVAVLAVIAVLALVAAIIYFAEPARSLPSVLGTITHPASRANAHRSLRGWIALVVAVICVAAAGFASRQGRSVPR